jgi:Matrixin
MLRTLSLLLIVSLALYWYAAVGMVCQAPLSYQIALPIDERFGITQAEAAEAVKDAEAVWEETLGRELFYASEGARADVTINFVFGERQAAALAEADLRERLEDKQMSSSDLQAQYDKLVSEYQEAKKAHEARVGAYEARLSAYNAEVARYNDAGGAPPDVYEELGRTEAALAKDADQLEADAESLKERAAEINKLGEAGNQIIRQYNDTVETYNEQFGTAEEFTEGDYQDGRINVYTFANKTELVKVLAHELGHALSVSHVEGSNSVMYYLLEDQPTPLTLSPQDTAAVTAVCGDTGSVGTKVRTLINRYIL